MSKFPRAVVVPVVSAVALLLTAFGWLDEAVLGLLCVASAVSVVGLTFVGVRAIRDARRPIPEPRARVSYPSIAALEHDTGIFDLYTKLGAQGHDEVVVDACATCAEERAATAAGDHNHDRLYTSGNQIVCGVCWAKVAHIDSCWHPAQKRTMSVRGPVCGLCDRSLSGSLKPPRDDRSARDFAVSAYEAGQISPDQIRDLGLTYEQQPVMTTRRDDHYEYVVYACPACHTRSGIRFLRHRGSISSVEYQCGACGEVRTTKLPASPVPDPACRHVWQKQKGSEACDRFGTRYMQYGCVKCTATRACYEGASPYDQ